MKTKREIGMPAGKRAKMPSVKKDLRASEQITPPGVPGGPVPGVRGPRPGDLGIRGNRKPKPGKFKS